MKNKRYNPPKEELEAYENLSEEEKNRRAQEIEALLLDCLEGQLGKKYVDPENLDLLEKAKIITIE